METVEQRAGDRSARVQMAREGARVALAIVRANGGWKHRAALPMSDEEVARQAVRAAAAIEFDLVRLEVARQLLEELGRTAVFEARLRDEGLA